MNVSHFRQQTLQTIVAENPFRAAALDNFGIAFYEHPQRTLADACARRCVSVDAVVRRMQRVPAAPEVSLTELRQSSLPTLIAYLQEIHRVFIREKLPYMLRLTEHLDVRKFDEPQLGQDLKIVLPMFVQDFVQHILDEEATLFAYIRRLVYAQIRPTHLARLYYDLERHSMQAFAAHHAEEDDEMRGIRELTGDYDVAADTDLHVRVIYAELQHFEAELNLHATVENDLLFPRAVALETEVRDLLRVRAALQ